MKPSIAVLVLAAGKSSRFGEDKRQHLLNTTLNSIALSLGNEINTFSVILKPGESLHDLNVDESLQSRISVIEASSNENFFGDNLREGLLTLCDNHESIIIALGDMPYIKAETYKTLVHEINACPEKIHRPYFNKIGGHPLALPTKLRSQFAELSGDTGAKLIIKEYDAIVNKLNLDDDGILSDVDYKDDLKRYNEKYNV